MRSKIPSIESVPWDSEGSVPLVRFRITVHYLLQTSALGASKRGWLNVKSEATCEAAGSLTKTFTTTISGRFYGVKSRLLNLQEPIERQGSKWPRNPRVSLDHLRKAPQDTSLNLLSSLEHRY